MLKLHAAGGVKISFRFRVDLCEAANSGLRAWFVGVNGNFRK